MTDTELMSSPFKAVIRHLRMIDVAFHPPWVAKTDSGGFNLKGWWIHHQTYMVYGSRPDHIHITQDQLPNWNLVEIPDSV